MRTSETLQSKMHQVEERIKVLSQKFENSDITISDLSKFTVVKKYKSVDRKWIKHVLMLSAFVLVVTTFRNVGFSNNPECLLDMPRDAPKLFRKPEQCDICEGFTQVDKITNVSPNFLLENYIDRFKPVVVSDGALNWPAKSLFTFDFFKSLFQTVELRSGKDKNCQFFPYETEFTSVKEVFNMSADRVRGNSGEKPWYVGWNNCNDEAGRYLKQFYDRPYFLSNMSEQMSLSWVFMGTPGYGAHMHVDDVHFPSWQAQLGGKKLWKLAPPPECYLKCKEVEVVVHPGEIIVLDTNRWYHQTRVLPGDISITIGAEFD